MPILRAARNILRYLSEKSKTMKPERLLYFCAVYGLSHAARNVLNGKYGEAAGKSLTIDTPLLVPKRKGRFILNVYCLCIPLIGVVEIHSL